MSSQPKPKVKSQKPVMKLFLVTERKDKPAKWQEIAALWLQKPGFYNLDFYFPLDLGTIFLASHMNLVVIRDDEREDKQE
ncbi:MAG: hypothetical protein AAGC93_28175 [Cyanobacteria bacterium P01_F01_bin.53]